MKTLKQEAEKLNFSRHHEDLNLPNTDVSAKYGCQKRTVKNTWQRYLSTASVRDRHRPGRSKIFSVRSERRIVRKHEENPFLTAVKSGDQWAVSRFTVGRILKKYGLQWRKPHKVPVISQHNKKMRPIFADKTRSWNQQWKQILWSDERFCLHQHDGRIKIYRQPKTRYAKRNHLQFDRWKIGGITEFLTTTVPI